MGRHTRSHRASKACLGRNRLGVNCGGPLPRWPVLAPFFRACYSASHVDKKAPMQAGILALAFLATSCIRDPNPGSVSGTIETDEARVASRYGGRVEKILADEGDTLKTGQVIVELDAAELGAKRDQAAAQLAELEAGPRKEEIEAAKHDWEALIAEA